MPKAVYFETGAGVCAGGVPGQPTGRRRLFRCVVFMAGDPQSQRRRLHRQRGLRAVARHRAGQFLRATLCRPGQRANHLAQRRGPRADHRPVRLVSADRAGFDGCRPKCLRRCDGNERRHRQRAGFVGTIGEHAVPERLPNLDGGRQGAGRPVQRSNLECFERDVQRLERPA